jgi:uncharacterized protein YdaU (DUF1376 family)
MDTSHWTTAQVGAYFRLLMYEWVNGGVPTKMAALARIAGIDVRNMQKMWSAEIAKKFTLDGAEMYVNLRLEETRLKQLNYQERQAEKGRKSAEIRAKLHPTVVEPGPQPEVNSSSSISSSIKKEKNIYGQFQNVLLTDYEKQKVSDDEIERLSIGIASKGYKYKSHYATILSWRRKDRVAKTERSGALYGRP